MLNSVMHFTVIKPILFMKKPRHGKSSLPGSEPGFELGTLAPVLTFEVRVGEKPDLSRKKIHIFTCTQN